MRIDGAGLPRTLEVQGGRASRYFEELGLAVESAWKSQGFRLTAFPGTAAQCLADFQVPPTLDAASLLRDIVCADTLPVQEDPRARFGQPPITLYRGREFYVAALYWLDGTTTIHQHGFSGAFRVLEGRSLHTPYEFEAQDEHSHRLLTGILRADMPELLRSGAVRAIEPGGRFIHSLFHLDRPSVTVIVRTYSQPTGTPQFNYLHPGVAYDPFYKEQSLERRIQAALSLASIDRAAALSATCAAISQEDLWASFLFAMRWFNSVDDTYGIDPILDQVSKSSRSLADVLRDALTHQRQSLAVIKRRRLLHDPDHRMFLALLLNVKGRRQIEQILADGYPSEDPPVLLARWIRELADPSMRGLSGLVLNDCELESVQTALELGHSEWRDHFKLAGPPPDLLEQLFTI